MPTLMEQVPRLMVTSRGMMGYGVSTGGSGGMMLRGISSGSGQVMVLIMQACRKSVARNIKIGMSVGRRIYFFCVKTGKILAFGSFILYLCLWKSCIQRR